MSFPALPPSTHVKPRVKFPGLAAAAFQHELDRQATTHLGTIPGLDWLVARVIEYGIERKEYVINLGSNLRIGPRQLPKIYRMLQDSCAILDMAEPELYLEQGGINAHTSGHDRPYIVLLTGLVELLDDDELMAVIAHELGHIKCQHLLYKMMAFHLSSLLDFVPGAGRFAGHGVEAALLNWSRRAELSADRAALLVMQDARPCLTLLMKLAGGTHRYASEMSLDAFLQQAATYQDANQNVVDRLYRFVLGSAMTHPFAVERAKSLGEWAGSEQYLRMVNSDYQSPAPQREPGKPPGAPNSSRHSSRQTPQEQTPQEMLRAGWGAVRGRAFDATQSFIDKNRPDKPDQGS